ncbi:propeptide PepSY amd peptidase M4 [Thermoanaerobacter kivui]|uniref:Propeptide PepSY amd peptidase M4 n=1 Tax=Thermoanaerobacter kivui TaxID=2325 RepID=A0A097AQJ7_THEKI|nr:YcdB/YcdC domain-containing protein [Thermoanaerobacter kivui]AIS52062.1 propeptide PepSY amd peptidase M4 [Thermoanaerobacter kivui]
MKKFISIAIALAFLFTLMIPSNMAQAQADTKISLKQAIEIAKEKLGIGESGYEFNSSYNEYANKKYWNLNWNSTSKGSISVTVDADTGRITNFYSWTPAQQSELRIPKYTQEEAKKVAVEFIQKLVPDLFKQTKENTSVNNYSSYYSPDYSFTFERIVNGIPFPSDSIYVSVNKSTLKVTSYYLNWNDYSFPEPKDIISKEKAIEIFKEKLGIELMYNLVYDQVYGSEPKAVLVYGIFQNAPIDAKTGKIIRNDYYYEPMYGGGGGEGMSSQKLSPEEQKAVDNAEKYISKDKAIEIVKNSLPFPLGSEYKLTNVNLYTGYDYPPAKSNPMWSLYWSYNKDNKYYYVSATVDAATGEFKSFFKGGPDDNMQDKKPAYTEEEMKKTAEDYLKKIVPDKFSKTEYQNINPENNKMIEMPTYSFRFVEKANGILCPFNNISVTVSPYTGEIVGYALSWTDVKLPSSENIISLDEAYKILFENAEFSLMYAPNYDYKSPDKPPTINLVYQLNFYNYIDAKTGQIIDYSGKPVVKKSETTFKDIDGNWAEKDIKLLVQIGIIDTKDDKFYPEHNILQKDFIKMLIKAIQPPYYDPIPPKSSDEYSYFYDVAIQKKIITEKEKKPDTLVTREQAAKYLVNALGAGYIADLNDIFVINFKDADKISSSSKGYIAIVSGLKIMRGSNGYFYPDLYLTRAEAAAVLVRYLQINKN